MNAPNMLHFAESEMTVKVPFYLYYYISAELVKSGQDILSILACYRIWHLVSRGLRSVQGDHIGNYGQTPQAVRHCHKSQIERIFNYFPPGSKGNGPENLVGSHMG